MTHLRRPRAPIIGLALLAASIALATGASGCDDAYEPACRVTARRVLVSDPMIGGRPLTMLVRTRDHVTAWWRRHDVLDGGAGPDGSTSEAPLLTGFELADVDELGTVTRTTVPAPEALRARRASVDDIGVVSVASVESAERAFVVHWTETTVTTDVDGRVRTASAVKASRVSNGIVAEPATVLACERCMLAVTFLAIAGEATAIVRIDPDHGAGLVAADLLAASGLPRFATVGLRADGSVYERPAPWLAVPARSVPDGGLGGISGGTAAGSHADLTAEVVADGWIAVTANDRAWLADDQLRLVAGPIELPSAPDVRARWRSDGEASVAWSVSPFDDARSDDRFASREIFTGIYPPGAAVLASRERTSRGTRLLAFDRRGEDLGVLFESVGRTFFASVDPRGKKRGGDLLVASAATPRGSQPGAEAEVMSEVVARGDHRFTVVTLGDGELVATEVTCAP